MTRYNIDDLDRAIADGEAHGFIKVLTAPGGDRIRRHHRRLPRRRTAAGIRTGHEARPGPGQIIMATIHVYPTLGETNRFLASGGARPAGPSGCWAG